MGRRFGITAVLFGDQRPRCVAWAHRNEGILRFVVALGVVVVVGIDK